MCPFVSGNVDLARDALPRWIGLFTTCLRSRDRNLQRLARKEVCKRVVRHVTLAFRHGVDGLNVVAMAGGIVSNAARPKSSHVAEHRPAILAQPPLIARGQVVLPLRNSDLGSHMDLALAERQCRVRSLLRAVFRVCLPRIHRSSETVLPGALLGSRQAALTE